MTRARARRVMVLARRAKAGKAAALYEEVYGAKPADNISPDRVRESVVEACAEMLEQPKKTRGRE